MDAAVFKIIRRIAAIFVVSFSLGILCHYYWAENQPEQFAFIENIVPLGSKSEIKMPDGSMVWLNAGSTLRYSANFGVRNRDIYLTGEGYFIVTQQTGKPFTVYTALEKITDLGTEFNVKAYLDENVVETTVIKGELAVDNAETVNTFNRIILKSGQKLSVTVSERQPTCVITQLDPYMSEAEVSWKESNWRIESETLQNLAVQLERRYDVHIRVDDRLKDNRFTGPINDESLEQVLHQLQIAVPILFRIEGKNVDIFADPNKIEN
jgi:ferric-dicitrate binding protein FerR (iron transport regulator)